MLQNYKSSFKMNQPFFRDGVFDYQEYHITSPYQAVFYEYISSYSSSVHSLVPSGCLELCFVMESSGSFLQIVGSPTECSQIKCTTGAHYFGVRLCPGLFLRMPNFSLRDIFSGETIIPANTPYLRPFFAKLKKCTSFQQRIDCFLSCFVPDTESGLCGEIACHMIDSINQAKGNLHINELAEEMNYSERHVSRIFQDVTGMTPKTFSRIVRFQHAVDAMLSAPQHTISEYIIDLGYSDQAHFQREFKQYTGMTPKSFMQYLSRH